MTHTTVAEVRRISGVTSIDKASDDDVRDAIVEAEQQLEKYLNASFTPQEIIENLDGNGTYRIFVSKNPLLAVRALKIDGADITLDGNIFFKKPSGKIELNPNGAPETSRFKKGSQKVIIKYIHGWLEQGNKSTELTADSSPGQNVDLSVASEAGFSKNDWIEIYGMDGNHEAAKITAVAANQITVDNLSFSHEDESIVIKLEVSEVIKKLMRIFAGIALVARVVGESSEDIVGYSIGEFQVQKGEPYTQWRETTVQLIKERDEILQRVRKRPAVF
ncbi:hypothetical protein KKD03_05330 [Patescibacteria group bacterium]|nr:hypothetical protein [Patescibacteria group bacterium]